MVLEKETRFFEAQRQALIENHEGQFVVIKGEHLLGAYTTFAEAYEAGVNAYGTESFMVKQVSPEEGQVLLPALNTGLMFLR
jgi:hypothetical protein